MEILGKEYNLKFGLRSMFIFETITGNTFNINTIFDSIIPHNKKKVHRKIQNLEMCNSSVMQKYVCTLHPVNSIN